MTDIKVVRKRGIAAVKNPIMLSFEEIWKTLQFWTRKAFEYCNQSLAHQSSRSLEDNITESNADCGALDHKVSKRTKGLKAAGSEVTPGCFAY